MCQAFACADIARASRYPCNALASSQKSLSQSPSIDEQQLQHFRHNQLCQVPEVAEEVDPVEEEEGVVLEVVEELVVGASAQLQLTMIIVQQRGI